MEKDEIIVGVLKGIGGIIGSIAIAEFFTGIFSHYMDTKSQTKTAKYEAKYNGKAKDAEIARLTKLVEKLSNGQESK